MKLRALSRLTKSSHLGFGADKVPTENNYASDKLNTARNQAVRAMNACGVD